MIDTIKEQVFYKSLIVLAVENITKRFSGVIALNNVSMEFHAGKVNAILGENGAGKSTLMKILSGVYSDYEGRILYKNNPVTFASVREAQDRGIAIIHQELNLIPYLTIQENIFLGREIVNALGLLNKKAMKAKTVVLLQRLELNLDPDTLVLDLKVGQQQLIEIAKALLNESDVIIMDEPTSAISDKESEILFGIMHELKKQNKTIVYISHKLDELFRIADRYIVMRDGCLIESGDFQRINRDDLIQKMVGRKINLIQKHGVSGSQKEEVLRVDNLCLKHEERSTVNVLKNISFRLSVGEIVGLFGLMGAGRTELMETLFGLHPKRSSGAIYVQGKLSTFRSPSDAIKAGIALVPEDRKKDGLVLGLDVRTNICLASLEEMEQGFWLTNNRESTLAQKYIGELSIKTSSEKQSAKNLSGGNQQKIVIAKWLAKEPKILLLDEPTRGVDVGAKNEIYKLIVELSKAGMAIIMVSSELPEIFAVSDRVLVMSEGSLTAEIPIDQASEHNI
ncbi:MAG TPA: sugar ABC transporter ATP-binding protein, partial [Chryseolinea sp.]